MVPQAIQCPAAVPQHLKLHGFKVDRAEGVGNLYLINLEGIRFAGAMDRVPLLVHSDDSSTALQSLLNLQQDSNFVLVFGGAQTRSLIDSSEFKSRAVLFGPADVTSLLAARDQRTIQRRIADVIVRQVPKRNLIAYNTLRSAESAMFYGRESELAKLNEELTTSFAVVGPSRIGKTSLLKQHHRWLVKNKPRIAFATHYVDFYACADHTSDGFARFLAMKISCSSVAHRTKAEDLVNFLTYQRTQHGQPLNLLLDEVDEVIEDAMVRDALGTTARAGTIRLVLAGRGNLLTAMTQASSNLAGRLLPLILSPLDRDSATRLLKEPLEDLGFRMEDEKSLINHVLDLTGRLPHLVQLYARRLAEILIESQEDRITRSHIDLLSWDPELSLYFLSPIEDLTNARTRRVAVSLLADSENNWTVDAVHKVAVKHGVELNSQETLRLCHELYILNILSLNPRNGVYSLAYKALRQHAAQMGLFALELGISTRVPQLTTGESYRHFQPVRVGTALISEIRNTLEKGESCVLLGPRHSDRVVAAVLKQLRSRRSRIVRVFVDSTSYPFGLTNLSFRSGRGASKRQGSPIEWIQGQATKEGRLAAPFILVVENVDALPHYLAREFLQQIRTEVESRTLIALLTGEGDLRDLVHGPNSEFNCAHQYVLAGLEKPAFDHEMRRYWRTLGLPEQYCSTTVSKIYELAGGDPKPARSLIQTLAELPNRRGRSGRMTESDLPTALDLSLLPSSAWVQSLRSATDRIGQNPEVWPKLEALRNQSETAAEHLDGRPGTLQLAGVAVRDGDKLRFASTMMSMFVRTFYTNRRFADLYAKNGNWEEAFRRYEELDPKERLRPSSYADHAELEPVMTAASTALFGDRVQRLSERGAPQRVEQFAAQVGRLVLGFQEVAVWKFTRDGWTLDWDCELEEKARDQVVRALPIIPAEYGVLGPPATVGRYGLTALVSGDRLGSHRALSAVNLSATIVMSKEREVELVKFLDHFVRAHRQASESEWARQRLKIRDKHIEILNEISSLTATMVLDPGEVLKVARRELASLGYKRVFFCLVDARRERIQGVPDPADPATEQLAEITDCSLDGHEKDIQAYIIRTAKSKAVPLASDEVLCNPKAVELTCQIAVGFVPLLVNPARTAAIGAEIDRDVAIGTMQIEREDGDTPTGEELADLELFGRQLARILIQCQKNTILRKSLDKIPEPLAIVDSLGRPWFANDRAAKAFALEAGWRDAPEAADNQQFKEFAKRALDQTRSNLPVDFLGHDKEFKGEVLCENIRDWQSQIVGGLIHAMDERGIHVVLEALAKMGQAETEASARRALLDGLCRLGFERMRFYLAQPDGTLKSCDVRGHGERNQHFQHGLVEITNTVEDGHSWLALEKREPVVFIWDPNQCGIHSCRTERGLEAYVIGQKECPEYTSAANGAMWVDLPLYADGLMYGKISLDCPNSLGPDQVLLLRVLCEHANSILTGIRERERNRKAALASLEASMAAIAHNLGSRIASTNAILGRYRLEEADYPALKEINDDFKYVSEHVAATIRRAREMLGKVTPKPAQVNLRDCVERSLKANLKPAQFEVLGENGSIRADAHLLESAIVEIVQNSRQAVEELNELRMDARLEHGAPGWVKLVISDNGPGIPQAIRGRIFEEFYSHRPGRQSGSGLGLSFVKRVIDAHGGKVQAIDGPWLKGACLEITLPVNETEG